MSLLANLGREPHADGSQALLGLDLGGDRIRTTDNPDECPVVADFRAYPRRWLMTVAHLSHILGDCTRTNLKALCNPCHCRYDLQQMGRKQLLKRERYGQLRINGI